MTDPRNPAAPGARTRPSSVTISSYLLILFAVLQVIGLIVALTVLGKMMDVFRDAYAGTSMEGAETVAVAAGIGAAVVGLLLAIGFVVLAVLNNRGKNASRIVTWVLGGIALCCMGFGLAGNALSGSMGGGQTNGDVPSQEEIQRRLDAVLPSWYEPVSTLLTVLALVALLVALILLALPKSNEFFRKPQTTWEPPVPGAAYPGYGTPGYPQQGYPGQSPAGGAAHGEPGYPPVPGNDNPPGDRPGPSAPPPTS